MERYVYKIIPAKEISGEFPFVSRYWLKDPLLLDSVARRGVLQPILVVGAAPRHIIAGHKRLCAAQAAGLREIPAFEIAAGPDPRDLYLLAIFSNWNQAMSDLDRAWAIHRAVQDYQLSEKSVIEDILPALGLEPQRHFLEEYGEVARLDASVLEAIGAGKLPFRGVRGLNRFSKPDQMDFIQRIVERAALTSNQLLKTGEWLFDLLKLKDISLAALLKTPGLEAALEASSQDRRQKGEKFYAALRALRFPGLARKEKEFESLAGKIEADQRFSLEAPSFFEGEGLTLRAKLPNPEALDKLAAAFSAKRKLFNSLFDVML
ncbi:MAG TPA: ParB/RepB/Spo0J family partition protein [bacterium]|nr:ParB/RepB/Spo0J family partition protein [bacterium]